MSTEWWKHGIVYQIYPRSFQDTNGDGIGDLRGILKRLDYIADLGVDAIWISPIFLSPMADFGYDVADYCAIDPIFGTLEAFDELAAQAHARGLKIILDFVPNHTSDQHAWFQESRASRDNRKRDWYIWRDGKPDDAPPNNWISNFGGSAWEKDPATGQSYYHAFLKEQPDLNWRNPEVRAAMCDVLRFWMRRGVDGFRIDVLWHLIKDALFRDNPPNPGYHPGQSEIEKLLQTHSADQPEIFDVLSELRACADEFPDRVLIGEIYLPLERLMAYYGRDRRGVHLPFNFQLLDAAWSARGVASLIEAYEKALPEHGWPNWVLSNHDRPRIAARVGPAQARIAAMLLLTLRGTPTMYYGDEIGLGRIEIPREAVQDPWEKREPGLGLGRDPSRTPMLWEDAPNAGFTTGAPWLPLGDGWQGKTVLAQTGDPDSILSLYRALIALRRQRPALLEGSFRLLSAEDDVLIYDRYDGENTIVVALNFSAEPRSLALPPHARKLLLASQVRHASVKAEDGVIPGDAGLIFVET